MPNDNDDHRTEEQGFVDPPHVDEAQPENAAVPPPNPEMPTPGSVRAALRADIMQLVQISMQFSAFVKDASPESKLPAQLMAVGIAASHMASALSLDVTAQVLDTLKSIDKTLLEIAIIAQQESKIV